MVASSQSGAARAPAHCRQRARPIDDGATEARVGKALAACLLVGLAGFVSAACGGAAPQPEPRLPAVYESLDGPVEFALRGAWLAPRSDAALDSAEAAAMAARMRASGITHVAIGHDVEMPRLREPELRFGQGDDALRRALRAMRAAGLATFLLPRIESPDFFVPPFPFRADIRFETAERWERFHAGVERMLVHYAALARDEGVALFGVGLELKHSVRGFESRWREILGAVRAVYPGPLTYSANWYDEWQHVGFWDALDYIGVGAYFELDPADGDTRSDAVADVRARWTPHLRELEALAARVGRPILFTEIGYTGYADCVERPWEWSGKQTRGVAIDHVRQAEAFAGLFGAVGDAPWLAGTFVWSYYASSVGIEGWEYAVQERPAERVVRRAYGARD